MDEFDRAYANWQVDSYRLDLKLTLWIADMGKIEQFADDAPDALSEIETTFGELGGRMRALRERANDVAHRYQQHFENQEKQIARAEEALGRLSNMPIPGEAKAKPVEAKPSESAHLGTVKAGA